MDYPAIAELIIRAELETEKARERLERARDRTARLRREVNVLRAALEQKK